MKAHAAPLSILPNYGNYSKSRGSSRLLTILAVLSLLANLPGEIFTTADHKMLIASWWKHLSPSNTSLLVRNQGAGNQGKQDDSDVYDDGDSNSVYLPVRCENPPPGF
jgi:hypothetical protein